MDQKSNMASIFKPADWPISIYFYFSEMSYSNVYIEIPISVLK